jgi:UDP:flavonoid glycosyltransferase YjiC (YdhE family)
VGRFLFVGGDAGGDVPPRLSVMAALARRGHRVDHVGLPWLPPQIGEAGYARGLRDRAQAAGASPLDVDEFEPADPARRIADAMAREDGPESAADELEHV